MTQLAFTHGRAVPGPGLRGTLRAAAGMRSDPLGTMSAMQAEFGEIYRLRLIGMDNVVSTRPEAAEHVLQHQHKNYRKGLINAQFKVLDGEGLITSEGELWTRQRKLAQPAFHRQRLARLAGVMSECADGLVARWLPLARSGDAFRTEREMMRLTLQVASRTLFSQDVSEEAGRISAAVDVARDYITARFYNPFLPTWLPIPANLRFKRARKLLDDVVYRIIAERRRNPEDRGDLLSMLMAARDEETGAGMDDTQLRDEVMTMLMAGHESTAVTLTWVWDQVGRYPEVQARLHEEADRVLNGRLPTFEDLPQLPYARMVIEETLRVYPVVWALSRQAIREDDLLGYRVPASSYVTLGVYFMHRHPEFWRDAARFDPERFADGGGRHPGAYLPFGAGPRGCIGRHFAMMEAQITLAAVMQRFEVRLADPKPPEMEARLSLRPKNEVPVVLKERP